MGEAVLVFPAGMPDGLAFRDRAKALGLHVIGASSLDGDPAQGAYDEWEQLPYISDPDFDRRLAEVVSRHAVTAVHTPHFVVWKHLSERLAQIAPGARLTGDQRPEHHEQAYRDLRARVAAARTPAFWGLDGAKPRLSTLQRTGLVRLVDTIPGMCGEDKMHAVMEIMRHAPPGDVVEIGSWWGRSAALFAWLTGHYDIGSVLCVDPWSRECMTQGDALLDSTSAELDTEDALRMFEINLAPLAGGRLNYLRARAEDGAGRYGPGLEVTTEAFGTTHYSGAISVLHIDGNHAYEHAARDTELWTPHVAPGGWIIFDDYEWAFGDGPKRVADTWIAANGERIATVFTAGPSMFVQLKAAAHG